MVGLIQAFKERRLRERRGSLVFDPELDWLFNYSEGDMGKRAAFIAEPTGPNPSSDDNRVRAAQKEREYVTALAELSEDQQRALRLVHRQAPPGFIARWKRFGEHAAVCIKVLVDERTAADILARRERPLKSPEAIAESDKAQKAIEFLQKEAHKLVVDAVKAYREARKAQRESARRARTVNLERILKGA